tara:strand:- start:48562 stop:48978 length:417 start_codon:yes stop_codon:yes gene_type:complete
MMQLGISFISGIIFALGLVISGMTNPDKVIGFLDITGNWDYSLMFVMIGAISVTFVMFKVLTKKKPYCGEEHFLPTKKEVDKKIIIGSALFGIGWGMTGVCPGPGFVNLATNESAAFLFIISLLVGMILFKFTESHWS